jgi:hypothetical protein
LTEKSFWRENPWQKVRWSVVAREGDETFDVSPEEERALLAAIAQAERGEVVSWEQLREQLLRFG